jgi:hypothetical protein
VAQPLDILQPRAAAQHVVGQIQYVVGLVIRQMHLQQPQPFVDLFGKPELRHQPVHGADAAVAHGVRVRANLIVHRVRAEHRRRPLRPVSRPPVPNRYLPFAPSTVLPALPVRYSLHRKGFLAGVVISSPKTHNSNQDKPFRFHFDDPPVNITLVQGLGRRLHP